MEKRNRIYNYQKAEIALLKETSKIESIGDDYFFISKQFPSYIGGNGVIVNTSGFISLGSIIEQFKALYPSISSYTIYYFDKENHDKMVYDALLAQCTVDFIKIMYAPVHKLQQAVSSAESSMSVRVIKDEIDWELYKRHQSDFHTDSWFAEEGYVKTRFVADHLDMQWYALFNKNNSQILSSASILKVDNIARIEDLQTLPQEQRKGYATSVLEAIRRLLVKEKTIEAVYLGVEADNYKALRLYGKIGFEALPHELMQITIKP